ncbi:hypothetical protein GCM10009815_08100 [Nocardioides marmoribigeumensis]
MTYWSGPTASDAEGGPVDHVASSQFGDAGLSTDDTVYVISYVAGTLHVVTSLRVDCVVSGPVAEQILKRKDLWSAPWHVIAQAESVQEATMAATLTSRQLSQMRFINRDGSTAPPARNKKGQIDPQTFRSTRQIDGSTAAMLEAVLTGSR